MNNPPEHPTVEKRQSSNRGSSLDELLDVLADGRRRLTLTILTDRQTSIDAEQLAREVAARETDDPAPGAVDQVYLSLYHIHLPKLADVGVIEYDPDRAVVKSVSERYVPLLGEIVRRS